MFALFPALMPTSPHPPGQKAPRQFQTAIRLPPGSGGLRFMTAVGLGNCMACRLEHEARVEGGNPAALAGQAECSCFSVARACAGASTGMFAEPALALLARAPAEAGDGDAAAALLAPLHCSTIASARAVRAARSASWTAACSAGCRALRSALSLAGSQRIVRECSETEPPTPITRICTSCLATCSTVAL